MSGRPSPAALVLGAVLIGAGLFVAVRPLWTHGVPITGQRSLDMIFAIYFLVSGTLKIRRAIRRARA